MSKIVKYKVGRDAENGQFIKVKDAIKDPKHAIVETIKRTVK